MAKTLYDFGQAIVKIREAVNAIEIKGRQNSLYIVYVNQQCDELITEINELAGKGGVPSEAEQDGEINEQNSGPSE